MLEKVKIGLLGIIAVTVLFNTKLLLEKSESSSPVSTHTSKDIPGSSPENSIPVVAGEGPAAHRKEQAPTVPAIPSGPTTELSFLQSSHDFGTVNQNSENIYKFKFTNTGTEPLIISDAKGSCGCTVPLYPKTPIAPGASDEIEVVYKPGSQSGAQKKTVTITANTNPAQTRVDISANVIPE